MAKPSTPKLTKTTGLDTYTLRGMVRTFPMGERRRQQGALMPCLVRWSAEETWYRCPDRSGQRRATYSMLEAPVGSSLTQGAHIARGRHQERGTQTCFFTPLCFS